MSKIHFGLEYAQLETFPLLWVFSKGRKKYFQDGIKNPNNKPLFDNNFYF